MSKQRAKGTKFETACLPWIRAIWPAAKRTGSADYGGGDYEGTEDFLIEAKNHREMRLGPWMNQAALAAERNGRKYPIVLHKRKMFGPAGAFITMSLEDWVKMMLEARGEEVPDWLEPVSEQEEKPDF